MTDEETAPQGKADFSDVYNRADPRQYFRAIRPLQYEIPHNAHPVFETLLRERGGSRPGAVLDLCCSYGVNAALLRCEVTLEELFERYGDPALDDLTQEELADADRAFYTERLRPNPPRTLGLDAAERAIDYARRVDLLDAGWAEDLESVAPSDALVKEISDVGLISVTGGVGYITERTFDRLAETFPQDQKPWVAAFVLRMYSYDRIAASLAEHGLVTEQLDGTTFRQRRFATSSEQSAALREVRARGLDTSGKEDDGWYHCDFYLSRPASDVEAVPLSELLPLPG